MKDKNFVKIIEVGPRDGLQNESMFVSPKSKIEFIKLLVDAGFKEIETSSFVNPKIIPNLSDANEVLKGVEHIKNVDFSCLIPNLNGLKRAVDAGLKKAVFFTAASESFNKKNVNMSIDESLDKFDEMFKICKEHNIKVRGSISTCFECPYEGEVSKEIVAKVVDYFLNKAVSEISLCDTIGVIAPPDVEKLLAFLEKRFPLSHFSLHIHDTKGTALACVYKGYELGIRVFEASAGGLGGCPYAPGAAGNLATEELIYMFKRMNVNTGVDIDKLITASVYIEKIINRKLTSKLLNSKTCLS